MTSTTNSSATMQSSPRSRPCISAPDPKFSTVVVGNNRKRFVVHEPLLTYYSGFFRAVFTRRLQEAESGIVTLEEVDPSTFEFFVHWLYYQRFPDKRTNDDPELVDRFYSDEHPNYMIVVQVYMFGDKYKIPLLQRAVIDLLFNTMLFDLGPLPGSQVVTYVWEHLKEEDPLCRLLVDGFCSQDGDDYEQCRHYKCIPFLQAMWARYIKAHHYNFRYDRLPLELCDYHEHDTEEERKTCERNRKG